MQHTFLLTAANAVLALILLDFPERAQAFEITSALVHENLAVYLVRGTGQDGPTPLTLDQAMSRGAIRIYDDGPLAIENVSSQSVLVQVGDLLKGGLQDQVIGTSFMLPPRSGRVSLDTFCVDPFRSAARQGEKLHRFVTVGQFPSRMAKLSILTGSSESKAIRDIRQSGIWWSIDTLRSRLSDKLGVEMEPPRAAHWPGKDSQNLRANTVLAARRSSWTSGLPLALENRRLILAQQGYLNALNARAVRDDSVIGAVFAINGRMAGAEMYQSTALFRQAWPKLLRAYATEAIASAGSATEVLPSPATINSYLTAAQQGQTRDRTAGSDILLRDSEIAISSEVAGRDGRWVYRGYLPKLDLAATPLTPDATIVKVLETGRVGGRSITSLGEAERVLLQSSSSEHQWTATISGQSLLQDLWWRGTERIVSSDPRSRVAAALIAAAMLVLMFYVFGHRFASRNSRSFVPSTGEAGTERGEKLARPQRTHSVKTPRERRIAA